MASFLGNLLKGGGNATVVRQKRFSPGTLRYDLFKKAEETLNKGTELKSCVKKPDDEEFDDWLAVHVVDFYNRTQILYGTVSPVCTDGSCPRMTGTPKYEYLWADGDAFKVFQ